MHQLFANTNSAAAASLQINYSLNMSKNCLFNFMPVFRLEDATWREHESQANTVTDEDVQRPHSANAKRILNANEWIGVKNAPRQRSTAWMFEQVRSSRNMQHVVQATKRTSWILCFSLRLWLRSQLRPGLRSSSWKQNWNINKTIFSKNHSENFIVQVS